MMCNQLSRGSRSNPRIAIVGAGIIGLSTAFRLALHNQREKLGLEVSVWDPAPVSGASHHAGGMLAPAAEVVYQQHQLIPLMTASAALYPQLIADVAEVLGTTPREIGYRAEGTVVLAADRADSQHLHELRDYQRVHGLDVSPLTVRQVRKMEPALSPALAGAVHLPHDTQVAPRVFSRALLEACRKLGVKFEEQYVCRTDFESMVSDQYDQVLVANGLGASELIDGMSLRPVYGDIIRLRVPEAQRPLVDHVVRGFVEDRPVYIIPRADGTLAVGATSREDDRFQPRAGDVYDLMRDAIRLLPALEECDFLEVTTGARPGTPDDMPYLGRVDERTVVSTGYFRHGILLAAWAADVGSRLLLAPLFPAHLPLNVALDGLHGLNGSEPSVAVNLDSCRWDRHATRAEGIRGPR